MSELLQSNVDGFWKLANQIKKEISNFSLVKEGNNNIFFKKKQRKNKMP